MTDSRTKRILALLLMVFVAVTVGGVADLATAAPPIDEARALQGDGMWEEAAAAWEQVVREEPENAAAWFNLGYCLHAAGRLEEAIEVHQKASRFEEFHGIALYNLGCAYALIGRADDAFDALDASQEAGFRMRGRAESDSDLDSLHADPRFEALLAREPAGGLQQALARLQQFIQQQAPQIEQQLAALAQQARQVMGELHQKLAQDERFAAIAQQLQRLFGGDAPPAAPEASAADRPSPTPGPAGAGPSTAPEASPAPSVSPPGVSLERAAMLQAAGKWLEAAAMYEAVAPTRPDDPRAWFGLAYCLHMGGAYEKAVEAHKKAATFEQTRGISLYNLACAYSLLGRTDEAIEALRESREAGFDLADPIGGDGDLDNLRDDPRFRELVEEVGG